MELKTIKEFAHKNNLGEGLVYSNGVFKTNLDSKFNVIDNEIAEINNTLNKVYKVKGSTTVDNINTMTVGNAMIGYVYNMSDSGIITNGINGEFDVVTGDNIVYTEEGWDEFSVSLDLALRAGKNISIENDAINALGYTYDKEKESFSVGSGTATGQYSYAEGSGTAQGDYSHAEGNNTTAYGDSSHTEGYGGFRLLNNYRWGIGSKFITFDSFQDYIIEEVLKIENNGESIFVRIIEISDDGLTVTVDNPISLECNETSILSIVLGVAYKAYSHAEGSYTTASGQASHAEGNGTIASGFVSHAEGSNTAAYKACSHAEGEATVASGWASHSEGSNTTASDYASHAEGFNTGATGYASHAEGYNTITNNEAEHAQGKYNKSNKDNDTYGNPLNTQHSIGIGIDSNNRKNAQEVMQNGDYYVIGVGNYNGKNVGGEGVKTLQEVLNEILEKIN